MVVSKRWSVNSRQWVWGITAVALLLRLINLGEHSYWFDEAREVVRVLAPWPEVVLISDGADPPLYRLLLFPVGLLTTNEFWLRLPSVIFSTASVPLAYVWLRQWRKPNLGLVTAVLLTIAPVQIYYAQEVSQYSLTVFLALLILIAFGRVEREGSVGDWVGLTAVSLISFYTYYGLAWLFPVLDVVLAYSIWQRRSRTRIWGFVGFHVAVAVGLIALYVFFLAEQFNRFTTNKNLIPTLTNPAVLRNVDNQLLNEFVRFFTLPFAPLVAKEVVWLFAGLIALGLVLLWRQGVGRLVIVLGTAVFTMYLAFGLGLYPFGGRYALFITPLVYAALAAVWLAVWQWQRVTAVALAGLIGLLFIAFWPNLRLIATPWLHIPREELRPVVNYMQAKLHSDDFIYVYYGAVPAYQVYGREIGNATEYGVWFRAWPPEEKIADIQQAAGDNSRLWLVMSHITPGEDEQLVAGLEAGGYVVEDVVERENATAVLLKRP